jgi:tripartite ATP-independent transporter DctP family solute receptor
MSTQCRNTLLSALTCLLCLSQIAGAQEKIVDPASIKSEYTQDKAKYVFSIATPTAEDSVNHFIAWKFKHLIQDRSKGQMFANTYEASTLGSERETVEGMLGGTVDFYITISSGFVAFVPRSGVLDLPNAYPSIAVARKVLDGEIPRLLEADYTKAGLKLLGLSDAGFRETTSSRSIQKMEDFKGLKIRTMENANHIAYWKALGANPTPMDFNELYISLQQGAVDAQENPYDLIVANKLYEPQKYIVETHHLLHGLALMASKAKFDALPADLQKIVVESAKEAVAYGREIADKRIDSRKKTVTDYGCKIEIVSPEMRKQMIASLSGVYATMRKNIGDDLVDKFVAAIAEAEASLKK